MMRVPLYPEPVDFQLNVGARGRIFLAATPHPSNVQWRNKEYWNLAHDSLYGLYGGICVYCASWTARRGDLRIQGNTSVDHFLPKSLRPDLAYQWENFRLCRSQLNQRKDQFLDVMDPVAINNDWFQLNFYTFFIEPNPGANEIVRNRVIETTNRLGLNDNDYVKERIEVLKQYCIYGIPLAMIEQKYPFVAREIHRVPNFDAAIKPLFVKAFS
jgi:hypothetical protein